MPIEETALLAKTLQSLNNFQLVVFLLAISQIGLIFVMIFMLKNNSKENNNDSEQTKSLMVFMGQLYKSFQRVTEAFDREQKKDWQRNQYFFKHQERQFKLMKHIYFQIGQINKEIVLLKSEVGDIKNGQK